jgi:PAS domain S-box-containing protein
MAQVLIVDDERSIRVTLSEFLNYGEYKVNVASDADQALEMLAAENYDVVVTDIILPRMTGVKLLKSIKESAPRVQVVMMTGEPTIETASEAVRAGAFDYLTKPIGKEKLIKTVENAVKIKKIDDERLQLLEEKEQYQGHLELLVSERTEALRESEEKFRTLVETAKDAIVTANSEGNIILWNEGAQVMFGYLPDEILGQSMQLIMPEMYSEDHQSTFKHVVSGGVPKITEPVVEISGLKKDGDAFPLELSIVNWKSGQEVFSTAIIRDITERFQAEQAIQQHIKRLDALRKIDQAITGSLDLQIVLNVLLGQLLAELSVDAAAVLLYKKTLQTLCFCQEQGFQTAAFQYPNLRLGQGYAGKIALDRRTIFIDDLSQDKSGFIESTTLKKEGFVSYYGTPLIAKGEMVGVLEIFHRSTLDPNIEWKNFLEVLAGQAAIAIDSHNLFNNLQRSNFELMVAYDATIEGWAHALDLRDMETEGHSRRVVEITMKLAEMLNIKEDNLIHIRRGALLHDIGKMGVPDAILLKPGKLTEDEWGIMRLHPVYAYDWLLSIDYLKPALDIPYCHHERWDGTGYPRGLKGEEIPLSARIFAVVDVWDALRSDRPYRKAWSKEKTLTHIQAESGKHFDPYIVDHFIKYLDEYGDFY